MKSSSVRSIGHIASKIHPQVALTRTESQRLLDTLKASFRQQLDAEHDPLAGTRTAERKQSALSHAERHVASVLTNPLLATSQLPRSPLLGSDSRHPINIFNDCAASGIASIETATKCISAFHRSIKFLTPDKRRAEIAKYQPGSKVLQWLWATGLAQSEVVSSGRRLVSSVVALLLREGKEESIWRWLSTADTDTSPPMPSTLSRDQVSAQSFILQQLVYWKIKSKRDDLAPAIEVVTNAIDLMKGGSISPKSTKVAAMLLLGEVKRQSITAGGLRSSESISGFLQTAKIWLQSPIEPAAIDVARLSLRYIGSSYLDTALGIAKRLDIQNAQSTYDYYGTKVASFLLSLSEALQVHGSKDQVRSFLKLLQDVQHGSKENATMTLLSRELQGLPDLLLQEVETWSRAHTEAIATAPG